MGYFVSLANEIKRVLLEHPEILVEVLTARPQILYEALAKLTPWQNLATREDIRKLEEKIATKEDIKKLEERTATKEDVRRLEEATREELRKLEERTATKEDVRRLEEATREELRKLEERTATKEELKELREKMATKEEVRELREEVKELRDEMKELEKRITKVEEGLREMKLTLGALGARWGVFSEDAFRSGVRELLRDAGFSVERWVYYDEKGYVYGYPSEVELDIVVRDGKTYAVEITSALKRGDLQQIKRKIELFTTATGRAVDAVYIITPFIHDRNPDAVEAVANSLGLKVIWPRPE